MLLGAEISSGTNFAPQLLLWIGQQSGALWHCCCDPRAFKNGTRPADPGGGRVLGQGLGGKGGQALGQALGGKGVQK